MADLNSEKYYVVMQRGSDTALSGFHGGATPKIYTKGGAGAQVTATNRRLESYRKSNAEMVRVHGPDESKWPADWMRSSYGAVAIAREEAALLERFPVRLVIGSQIAKADQDAYKAKLLDFLIEHGHLDDFSAVNTEGTYEERVIRGLDSLMVATEYAQKIKLSEEPSE